MYIWFFLPRSNNCVVDPRMRSEGFEQAILSHWAVYHSKGRAVLGRGFANVLTLLAAAAAAAAVRYEDGGLLYREESEKMLLWKGCSLGLCF